MKINDYEREVSAVTNSALEVLTALEQSDIVCGKCLHACDCTGQIAVEKRSAKGVFTPAQAHWEGMLPADKLPRLVILTIEHLLERKGYYHPGLPHDIAALGKSDFGEDGLGYFIGNASPDGVLQQVNLTSLRTQEMLIEIGQDKDAIEQSARAVISEHIAQSKTNWGVQIAQEERGGREIK